jgi:thioredoxin 1
MITPPSHDYLDPASAPSRADVDRLPGAVVLEFGTAWCGFCQALAPSIQELVARHPGIQHIKVEDGSGRALGRSFGVRMWPNLVFLRRGQRIAQLARPDRAQLEQAFAALSSAAESP